jgi:glycosyltransferase involved in cell wall biosynthesis
MKFWIFQSGEPLPIDENRSRGMRAINLSNALLESGHEVVLWSARFNHNEKKQRPTTSRTTNISNKFKLILVPSCGYQKNISLIRLLDHIQLAFNLSKLIKLEEKPDAVFIGFPPIETAWVLTSWANKNHIPSILDVKDEWPELFIRSSPKYLRWIVSLLFLPQKLMAKASFRQATCISTITEPFLQACLAKANRPRNSFDQITFLTSPACEVKVYDLEQATNWLLEKGVKVSEKFLCAYIGSLTNSFDFQPIEKAALDKRFIFVLAGDGPFFRDLKKKFKNFENVILLGWINPAEASALYRKSKVVLAPYKNSPDFEKSLPNKFFDAMSHGKPIVTSIGGFGERFINENKVGFTYSNSEIHSLHNLLVYLHENNTALEECGRTSKNLFNTEFTEKIVYGRLVYNLELLAKN